MNKAFSSKVVELVLSFVKSGWISKFIAFLKIIVACLFLKTFQLNYFFKTFPLETCHYWRQILKLTIFKQKLKILKKTTFLNIRNEKVNFNKTNVKKLRFQFKKIAKLAFRICFFKKNLIFLKIFLQGIRVINQHL